MSESSRSHSEWRKVAVDYVGLLVALGIVNPGFQSGDKIFLQRRNLPNYRQSDSRNGSYLNGDDLHVLIVAEIDLSVGSVLGLCGAVARSGDDAMGTGHYGLR